MSNILNSFYIHIYLFAVQFLIIRRVKCKYKNNIISSEHDCRKSKITKLFVLQSPTESVNIFTRSCMFGKKNYANRSVYVCDATTRNRHIILW